MGLFDRVVRAHDEITRSYPPPEAPGTGVLVDTRWGHRDSRFTVEEYGDYLATSTDIYAIANLRARRMAALRPQLFIGNDQDKTRVTSGPAADLLRKVNPFWTFQRLIRMDELCMCLWGESYWAVEKNDRGEPVEIWWLKPSRVHPIPDESGYLAGFAYVPQAGGEPLLFGTDEIVWFRYPNPINEMAALSPMAAARLPADTSSAMMASNKALFDNGLQLGGMVMPTGDKVAFTEDQAKNLQRGLADNFKGTKNAQRWAVLRFEASIKDMGVTPKDAQFADGMNITLRQACRVYGIPSPLMNDLEHATLANVKELDRMLWEHGLQPDADFRASEIVEQFLPMFGVPFKRNVPDHFEWDYSQVSSLQEAASSVWDRERGQIEVGALTVNEWRMRHGLPQVPWGDVWWAPVNKAEVDGEDDPGRPPGDGAPRPADTDQQTERAWQRVVAELSRGNGHRQGALT